MSVNERADRRALRVFAASTDDVSVDADWVELTSGEQPAVRISALDLQQAQRTRTRIRNSEDVAVILDITVLVADDYRSAYRGMTAVHPDAPASVHYAGTVDGLAGLVADIFVAGVADGVTLIPATPQQDVRALATAVLARLGDRLTIAA